MARNDIPASEDRDVTNPKGGWTASHGFRSGVCAALVLAISLATAGALAAKSNDEAKVSAGTGASAFGSAVQSISGSADDASASGSTSAPSSSDGAAAGFLSDPATAAPSGAVSVAPEDDAASSTSASPTPVASSWSEGPVFVPPAPAPPLAAAAAKLAAYGSDEFGITIVAEGQDWGADEGEQVQNIGAVISAMSQLPFRVTSSVAANPNGALAVLSNRQGRTADGWQPYGDTAISFYANEDHGISGSRAANQVVLSTGSDAETVAHEVLHAYQFRDVRASEYVLALLADELRSFAAATGWEQLVSDDEVLAAQHEQWTTINRLYVYTGRELSFEAPNPLEAYAMAGAMYYTRERDALPDWPEYWDWFEANLD